MINIVELAEKVKQEGYSEENAESKLCQDIVLYLISKSRFNRNITIKGGVVMRSISNDARRATLDLGHRMGILGCSTAEMKMSLGC